MTILPAQISDQMAQLYQDMEKGYDKIAAKIDFSCNGCQDNCCDSYFLHHTYSEWAYLWEGLDQLPEDQLERYNKRAQQYIIEAEQALAANQRPQVMCPLNDDGLCGVYSHRLMICRMHGIPSAMTRPDGKKIEFPGCFRCQEIVEGNDDIPRLDRTGLYQRLVKIELDWLGDQRRVLPKVKKTIADMIVQGSPPFLADIT